MEGGACPGEGQEGTRARTLLAVASLTLVCALAWCPGAGAQTSPAAAAARTRRVCAPPAPLSAACTAVKAGEASTGEEAGVTGPLPGYLTPQDLHAAYALPSETNVSASQTIALIDAYDDPTAEADLGVFDEQFQLPACTQADGCFRKLNQHGQTSPLPAEQGEWAGESSIDVQIAHAVCESCHILLVEAENAQLTSLGAAVDAAAKAGATVISNSYESPEEPVLESYYEALNKTAYEHPGVVLTAAAGDCGYLNSACAEEARAANFPADSPQVVGVGGTTLSEREGVWSSTVWDEGGSGCSQIFTAPTWQSTVANFQATGCAGQRSVADVSAVANPSTGVDIYDSTPEEPGAPTGWTAYGGTSVASPIIAAEFALAGGGHAVADPAATLYQHAGEAGAFYDVVSGANGACGADTACKAAVGYDGPSGLGSPVGLSAFAAPEVTTLVGFTPSSGITGSHVTIEGSGLTAVSAVQFGALPAAFKLLSPTRIEATVPDGDAKSAPITLTATVGQLESKHKFKPTFSIASFSPQSGAPGTLVTIKGVGFAGGATVAFAGVSASVRSSAAKKLKVIVPAGAPSGPIAVTNSAAPAGTVYSAASFTP